MEDAFVIAHLMKKNGLSSASPASQEQLQAVCKEYQEQRGKRVGDTVLRARKRAAITHALEGMEQTNEWYTELAKEDGFHIMEGALPNLQIMPRCSQIYTYDCAFTGMSKTILGAPKELDAGRTRPEPVISGQPDHLLVKVADSA